MLIAGIIPLQPLDVNRIEESLFVFFRILRFLVGIIRGAVGSGIRWQGTENSIHREQDSASMEFHTQMGLNPPKATEGLF